jgi:hypothetical protein
MTSFKEPTLAERQHAAASAKKAALEKFRVNTAANNPAIAERQALRYAAHATRVTRAAERRAAKMAREIELAEEAVPEKQAEQDAAVKAEQVAAEQATRDITLQANRKAARDARYAARKARKK